jgi:cytochrome P450
VIFSAGPRSCLGKNLAQLEMKVMMIKFFKRYKNLVEHGWKDGKRAYDLKLVYCVKDTSVSVTKIT